MLALTDVSQQVSQHDDVVEHHAHAAARQRMSHVVSVSEQYCA